MKKILQTLLFMGIGGVLGVIIFWMIGFDNIDRMPFWLFVISYAASFVGIYVALIATTIIHEVGHLVCGLKSGYKFLSFRILSFNFCKYEDGFKIKRFSIPGTGGQCLMAPPEYNDGNFKYKLYLAGGNIATFIVLVTEILLALFVGLDVVIGRALLMMAIVSLYLFVLNVIPMTAGGVANDAYDIRSLGQNPEHKKEFWLSLDVNAKSQIGFELSEVGEDFDSIDDEELLKETEGIAIQIKLNMKVNYLLYEKRFEEAYTLCKKLVVDKNVIEFYKNELKCDKMFLEIMLDDAENVKKTYSDSVKLHITNTHKFMVQRMRLMYAYYLLIENDQLKAEKEKKCFEKACLSYPNLGEVKSERKIMEYVDVLHKKSVEDNKNVDANFTEDSEIVEKEA